MVLMRALTLIAVLATAGFAMSAGVAVADEAAQTGELLAIVGADVWAGDGSVIEDATVLVRGNKIEKVGPRADVKVPGGTETLEADGKVLLPGFVHVASRLGLSGTGGGNSNSIDPERTAADDLDPWDAATRWAAANGFTTLGLSPGNGIVAGRGIAVRTAPDDVESMVRNDAAYVRSQVAEGPRYPSSVAGALAGARKELDSIAKWKRDHAAWKVAKATAEKAKKKPPTEPKEPKPDTKKAAYSQLLLGEIPLLAEVGNGAGVDYLTRALADDRVRGEKLRLVALLSGDAYRDAEQLADLGATCAVRASIVDWPNTNDRICPAVHLRNTGIRVVLLPVRDSRDGLRGFRHALGVVVAAGFPAQEALRAATLTPAEVLGVAKVVGSIVEGKQADLQLLSGDPLLATTRLERVWIGGVAVEETP